MLNFLYFLFLHTYQEIDKKIPLDKSKRARVLFEGSRKKGAL